ncbi:YcjF family protein [Azospirillum rugosum]|uniref:Uncharacterized protein (DUF697 family) n=1 Tax=Azospirillum rugosum TaxID=416170 RepID=A0ABS4SFG2_9PROT|nr:DUF697 domain-containing protein [Azospirillum rugosum]MBP2291306.1 uncharacterized protein (DUF697 family) [Azospirillum rugosum]MDQ0525094.1 uncharacterized protein (DUF697 family) [Azospirillum rugosum]
MVIKKDQPGGDGTPDTAAEATPPTTTAPEPAAEASAQTTASEAAPAAEPAAAPTAEPAAASVADRAEAVIRQHVLLSAAAGVIPLNFVDTAALAVVQLRLLKELSEVHGVDFRGDIGRSAAGTLLATVAPTALAGGVLGSMAVRMALRSVPVVGAVTRLATQPAFNAAFTYALGKVFHQHFASGGTFLTFEPEKVKAYFRTKFEEARGRKGAVPETGPEAAPAAA